MKVTVNNQDKEEVIDWNKVQLVEYNDRELSYVVLLTSNVGKYDFGGTVVSSSDFKCKEVGYTSITFDKRMFKPFHGSITLQND